MTTTTTDQAGRLAIIRLTAMAEVIKRLNDDIAINVIGRDADIRAAAAAGTNYQRIADATGLTRQRIHQIVKN